VNEHEHEKILPEQSHPTQQEAEPSSYSPPAYAVPPNQEPRRDTSAGRNESPYRQRDYSGYVREREPGSFRPSGAYMHGNANRPSPYYQYGAARDRHPPGAVREDYQWDFAQYDSALPTKNRKTKRRGLVVFVVAILCVLCVGMLSIAGYNILIGLSGGNATGTSQQQPGTTSDGRTPPPQGSSGEFNITTETRPPSSDYTPAVGELMTIPQVVRVVRPSVVGVINYQTNQILMPVSEGSGIILTEDGYIITNAHVVEGAEAIVIVFDDKSEYEALLVGADARTDIAVLRVDRTGLPAAVLGDSNQLEVGETVIAIGNPGGLELAGTVTRGVVSAVNRVVVTPYISTTYIQTDAAINPGNSGGPLCNEFGQVIGINTAKIVEVGYEGIGFAIPISDAIPIIEELILHGRVTGRVLLGITGEIVTEMIARDRLVPAGVQIVTISSEEMANRGVLRGDIITYMDGQRVLTLSDIRTILETKRAGDSVTLTLHRPGGGTRTGATFEVEVPLLEDLG